MTIARITIGIVFLLPLVALAQQSPPSARTTSSAQSAHATVVAVSPIYENIVIGKNCQPALQNSGGQHSGDVAGATVTCSPVIQPKATANSYIAEYNGIKISGVTYRPLRIGDKVNVDVVTSVTPAE